MEKNNSKERFLILAPVGGDAQAMAQLLVRHGFDAQICGSIAECCAQLKSGSDALVLTEEALELANVSELLQELGTQPAWSELPLIILTTGGESRLARLLELAATAAGSVTLLERPIGSTTLLRTLEVALNSRRRQYQVRDLLEEQRRNELQLRLAHEQLADRARQLETIVELRTAKLAQSNERLRREITERKQAVQSLRQSQKQYAELSSPTNRYIEDTAVGSTSCAFLNSQSLYVETWGAPSVEADNNNINLVVYGEWSGSGAGYPPITYTAATQF
jgi:FixJ family two-component response regulator